MSILIYLAVAFFIAWKAGGGIVEGILEKNTKKFLISSIVFILLVVYISSMG